MRLSLPEIDRRGGRAATNAQLTGDGVDHELVFEVPAEWSLHPGTDPFLPTAVFVATAAGAESLVVDGPISSPLLAGARIAGQRYAHHLGRPPVDIVADEVPAQRARPVGRRVGLFVSRGIDSTCNLVLADRGELEPRPDVGLVITGIDTANDDVVDAEMCEAHMEAARSFGLEAVLVRTNVRSLFDQHTPWVIGIGPALAGVGLSLSADFSDVIVSSAVADARRFTGAHPDLDPLWGNGLVRFHHLPRHLERSERVRLVVEDGRGLEFLQVCWDTGRMNCGRCQKCLQTTALIQAFGGDTTRRFETPVPSAEDLRLLPPGPTLRDDFIAAADAAGAHDVAAAVAEHRDAPVGRPSPQAIHDIDPEAAVRSDVPWVFVTGPDDDSEVVGSAVNAAGGVGAGCVLGYSSAFTTHVRSTTMRSASATLWQLRSDGTDALLVVDALRRGSRPVVVTDAARARAISGTLPRALRTLIAAPHEVAAIVATAESDWPALARAVRSGGLGWLDELVGDGR
ncbi:hypothetical protein [Actinospongicola halichondriae]|uniref:hypothetical protein n=1 Tax=Actinospongicola halichondriae TaxID=3236844 RepID=UPI003D4902AC